MKIVVRLHGMAGVLVDDALLTGNASFAVAEQAMHARFESKYHVSRKRDVRVDLRRCHHHTVKSTWNR
jgi:hypothetical protein